MSLVLWKKDKNRGEIWITPEQYARRKESVRRYREKAKEQYKKSQEKKHPVDRNFFGKYDFARNKYFVDVSASGKEIWLTKAQFEKLRANKKKNAKNHYKKCKELPKTNIKLGDVHPEDPSLYATHKIANKILWGSKYESDIAARKRLITSRKKNQRLKMKRKIYFLNNKKRKRGEVNEQGMVFFGYYYNLKEIWLTPEEFEIKKRKENAASLARKKRKLAKPKEGSSSKAVSDQDVST